jgi:excisionase family DNA binding protein
MCSLAHPDYIREKARQMRLEKDLTIDEIAERLGISRQTIFYWVKDVPLGKPRRSTRGQRWGTPACA